MGMHLNDGSDAASFEMPHLGLGFRVLVSYLDFGTNAAAFEMLH
jgi:hypothetical protein